MPSTRHTAEQLRQRLSYDPLTGALTWLQPPLRSTVGSAAGGIDPSTGYVQLFLPIEGGRRKRYLAHRVIWCLMTGEWPAGEVDHRDTVRHNNVWTNLRDIPKALNAQNVRAARRHNKLGVQGVRFVAKLNKFKSVITTGKKPKTLGYFGTAEEAHAVYVKAKRLAHAGCTI